MRAIELAALAIVALFVAVRLRGPEPRAFVARLAILMVASWVGEDSCIRAYEFYGYDPGWSLFIDKVPLAIVLIWPIVIHSAWDLARCLLGDGRRAAALVAAAFVLADASMIEPIAVHAGLWRWTEPGVFQVPPIGILGWSFHAGWCLLCFGENERAGRGLLADVAAIVVAPLGTHSCLVASWWALFRWVNVPLSPWPFVALAWCASLALAARSLRVGARLRVPLRDILSRVPAALFFFVLLGLYARSEPALIAYAFAFAPPYLTLIRWGAAPEPSVSAAPLR
jgi:hypothetical protein